MEVVERVCASLHKDWLRAFHTLVSHDTHEETHESRKHGLELTEKSGVTSRGDGGGDQGNEEGLHSCSWV